MERHAKERLIGAAVLVAAAVILIPEMLSGPKRAATGDDTAVRSDAPLKTYTIDLSKSPTQSAAEEVPPATSAPPPESEAMTTPGAAPTEAFPESSPVVPPTHVAGVPDAIPPQATERSEVKPPAAQSGSAASVAAPGATEAKAKTKPESGWAVQLGSFSSRSTAEGMAGKLRSQGYDAFVMPVKTAATTLYRVRVGPMPDREAATSVLGKLKASVPAATVVKHP